MEYKGIISHFIQLFCVAKNTSGCQSTKKKKGRKKAKQETSPQTTTKQNTQP